jgi:hypothetical protein
MVPRYGTMVHVRTCTIWYTCTMVLARVPLVHVYRPKGGDAGAGARAGPHAARIVVEIRAADIAVELEP